MPNNIYNSQNNFHIKRAKNTLLISVIIFYQQSLESPSKPRAMSVLGCVMDSLKLEIA